MLTKVLINQKIQLTFSIIHYARIIYYFLHLYIILQRMFYTKELIIFLKFLHSKMVILNLVAVILNILFILIHHSKILVSLLSFHIIFLNLILSKSIYYNLLNHLKIFLNNQLYNHLMVNLITFMKDINLSNLNLSNIIFYYQILHNYKLVKYFLL